GLERPPVALPEQPFRFVRIETEVARGKLRYFTLSAQPRDGNRRLAPSDEHQGQALGCPGDQVSNDGSDVGDIVDEVVVVEDENRPRRELLEVAEEGLDDRPSTRPAGSHLAKQSGGRRGEVRIDLSSGGDEIVDEADPVPIVFVEAIPQGRQPAASREVREERGL